LNFFLSVASSLPDDVKPEILRCPLEQAVLRTKLLDLDPPIKMLALVIDPPRLYNIAQTILTLKEMGALFATAKGVVSPVDGDLSYLGLVVSRLPIDVHLGKLIMLGTYIHVSQLLFFLYFVQFSFLYALTLLGIVDLMCVYQLVRLNRLRVQHSGRVHHYGSRAQFKEHFYFPLSKEVAGVPSQNVLG
jgi:hypothetical protein